MNLRDGMSRWRSFLAAPHCPSGGRIRRGASGVGDTNKLDLMEQPEEKRTRGRPFEKGNAGRRPGSKNRRSLVSGSLLQGEEQELVRKAVELAKNGDVQMLKFLLARLLPRERVIEVDLPPMVQADDAVEGLGSIMGAVSEGRISPSEGAALATIVNSYSRALDIADFIERLTAVEDATRNAASQILLEQHASKKR